MSWLFGAFVGAVAGYWIGYAAANADVARECERLGGFYVGESTYKCAKV